jgi:hypothetical protein
MTDDQYEEIEAAADHAQAAEVQALIAADERLPRVLRAARRLLADMDEWSDKWFTADRKELREALGDYERHA